MKTGREWERPSPLRWLPGITITISRGTAKDFAKVTQCETINLADFLQWQISPREGTLTSSEYANADKPVKDREKGAWGWYSLAAYGNAHRNAANWLGSKIVVLDADATHDNHRGTEFAFAASELRKRLAGLLYVAMPSHSYTDEVPRWRIIIPVSAHIRDRDEYGAIARC